MTLSQYHNINVFCITCICDHIYFSVAQNYKQSCFRRGDRTIWKCYWLSKYKLNMLQAAEECVAISNRKGQLFDATSRHKVEVMREKIFPHGNR